MAGRSGRVTAAQVADAAGVSQSTVSFVLNDTPGQTISVAVRERVKSAAERLGYAPDGYARALASGSSRLVLVVLPDWPVEHALRTVLDEAADLLEGRGYTMVTVPHRPGATVRPLWETLRPDVVLPIEPLDNAQVDRIIRAGSRVAAGSGPRSGVRGVELQIEHLLTKGHRRLAYASTAVDQFAPMNAERLARAHELAAAAGASLDHAQVTVASATDVAARWRTEGVTGVAAFNDEVGAMVLAGAARAGLTVPRDLAIIGHDDAPVASLVYPALTSVSFDLTSLGAHLAEVALSEIDGGDGATRDQAPALGALLVPREST